MNAVARRSTLPSWLAILLVGSASGAMAEAPACTELAAAADLHVAWHPYSSQLRLRLDLRSMPGGDAVRDARATLHRATGGEVVWSGLLALTGGRIDVTHSVPDLQDGSYVVSTVLSHADCGPLDGPRREFEQRRFGWEHNGLGEGDEVIPPFTPLTVSGRRVGAVLREHRLGDIGLPRQIVSAGDALLAAPAHFLIRVNGQDVEPVVEKELTVVRESEGRVRTEVSWRAGDVSVHSVGEFEMDGMWRIDLNLRGQGDIVDRFDLVIPLRDQGARLLNAITDGGRHHTLGEVRAAAGPVWSSLETGRRALAPEFVPYIWIGDEQRGLAWFAESTRGWWLAAGRPTQELVRRGETLELIVHFTTRSGTLSGERRITFALQATPSKPRPEHPVTWRLWQPVCRAPFPVFRMCSLGSGLYWGSPTAYGHPYPVDRDYSLLRKMAHVRRGARVDRHAIDGWLRDHEVPEDTREVLRSSLRHALRTAADRPDALQFYINTHSAAWTPEFSVYGDEWRAEPFGDRAGGDADRKGNIRLRATESWTDYLLWYLDRHLETGAADGFFFDNTYLKADWNEVDGAAYRDEDGVLRPGVDIFGMRRLLKRAQVLVYRRRGAWLNVSHMTTTPIVPIQTWAGMSVDGEWKYGSDDYQQRFSRGLLRAASLGIHSGTVSAYLPGLVGSPEPGQRRRLERSLAAVTAVHEIRVVSRMEGPLATIWQTLTEFGYGKPDAEVHRYWDDERVFRLSSSDAEALVVVREGRALALVVSFGAAGEVDLSFGASSRSLADGGSCRDLEGRRPAPRAVLRGCRIQLPYHDFRLVSYASPGVDP